MRGGRCCSVICAFYQQRRRVWRSESAGWAQVWIHPVHVIIHHGVCVFVWVCVCSVVYEVIFFPSRVSTVLCPLLSDLLAPLFSWAPWQRPALSFPLCILLTLAAVSLPRRDKTRLNHTHTHTHTHTCALWCMEALNQHTFTLTFIKARQKRRLSRSLCSTLQRWVWILLYRSRRSIEGQVRMSACTSELLLLSWLAVRWSPPVATSCGWPGKEAKTCSACHNAIPPARCCLSQSNWW